MPIEGTPQTRNYAYTVRQRRGLYAGKFNESGLAKQFVPYYESQRRIEVAFYDINGQEYERKRGTVSMTTGWAPSFMLMLTRRSRGSSYRLNDRDKIVRVVR